MPPVCLVRTSEDPQYDNMGEIIRSYLQKNDILAKVSPMTIPGEETIMIFRRPMMSMYLSANNVNRKFVPETMRPTAVGSLNPISLKIVAL